MKEKTQAELKEWLRTATQEQIIEYWKKVTAPKYGYTKLIDAVTGNVYAEV